MKEFSILAFSLGLSIGCFLVYLFSKDTSVFNAWISMLIVVLSIGFLANGHEVVW